MPALQVGYLPAALATLAAATIGALPVGRQPRHPVGWLLAGMALGLDLDGLAQAYAEYGLVARPGGRILLAALTFGRSRQTTRKVLYR